MLSRINIYDIIKDHLKTLRRTDDPNSRFISKRDFFLFFIFPLGLGVTISYLGYTFQKNLESLIAGISILGGFLFNLLAIIYSQIDKIKQEANDVTESSPLIQLKQRFVKEIHSNISFCIVLSIILILTLLATEVDLPFGCYSFIIHKILIGLNYSLLTLFTLTLLMIINRVYILLKKDAE